MKGRGGDTKLCQKIGNQWEALKNEEKQGRRSVSNSETPVEGRFEENLGGNPCHSHDRRQDCKVGVVRKE